MLSSRVSCLSGSAGGDISLDPPLGPYDHLQGLLDAELSLVEYGDFECPYCRAAVPVIDEVLERFSGRIVFAWRQFPLAEIHPHALAAALAAEAAGIKGAFWPMFRKLFSGDEPHLRQADIGRYADEIGIPREKVLWPATRFVEDRVEADFNAAVRIGVRATPTLFVNGEMYHGPVTVDAVSAALLSSDAAVSPVASGPAAES